jgi:uncharacterized spore protein YtfJ
MDEDINLTPSTEEIESPSDALDVIELTMDKFLDTAGVDIVYGEPYEQGEATIIPCAEVVAGMGFGVGYGMGGSKNEEGKQPDYGGGSGGGGGGRTFSRPVAVVIVTPEGVRVEPVVDVTKIALAVFTAVGFIFGMLARMSRRTPPTFDE